MKKYILGILFGLFAISNYAFAYSNVDITGTLDFANFYPNTSYDVQGYTGAVGYCEALGEVLPTEAELNSAWTAGDRTEFSGAIRSSTMGVNSHLLVSINSGTYSTYDFPGQDGDSTGIMCKKHVVAPPPPPPLPPFSTSTALTGAVEIGTNLGSAIASVVVLILALFGALIGLAWGINKFKKYISINKF